MISISSMIGLLLALFLPGFFITLIFFKEANLFEKVMLSITFSIMISVAIGIGLGYNKEVKEVTGGITPSSVWNLELIVTAVFAFVALLVNIKRLSFKNLKALHQKYKKINGKKSSKEKEVVNYKKL